MCTNMEHLIVFLAIFGSVLSEAPTNQYGPPNQNYNNNNGGNNYNGGNSGFNGGSGGNSGPTYNPNNNVPILRLENNINGEQGYNYLLETGDGTLAQEQGYLKDPESPTAQGGFAFTAPDGQQFSIQYTADENGFQPQGSHLPTPPPIPEEILKALEQNSADEARGIVDDGQYRAEPAPHQQYNNAQQNGEGQQNNRQYNNQQNGQYNNQQSNQFNNQQNSQPGYKY